MAKSGNVSSGAQKFYCPCGGEVRMLTVAEKGKLRHMAQCLKCGTKKRKPSQFNEEERLIRIAEAI